MIKLTCTLVVVALAALAYPSSHGNVVVLVYAEKASLRSKIQQDLKEQGTSSNIKTSWGGEDVACYMTADSELLKFYVGGEDLTSKIVGNLKDPGQVKSVKFKAPTQLVAVTVTAYEKDPPPSDTNFLGIFGDAILNNYYEWFKAYIPSDSNYLNRESGFVLKCESENPRWNFGSNKIYDGWRGYLSPYNTFDPNEFTKPVFTDYYQPVKTGYATTLSRSHLLGDPQEVYSQFDFDYRVSSDVSTAIIFGPNAFRSDSDVSAWGTDNHIWPVGVGQYAVMKKIICPVGNSCSMVDCSFTGDNVIENLIIDCIDVTKLIRGRDNWTIKKTVSFPAPTQNSAFVVKVSEANSKPSSIYTSGFRAKCTSDAKHWNFVTDANSDWRGIPGNILVSVPSGIASIPNSIPSAYCKPIVHKNEIPAVQSYSAFTMAGSEASQQIWLPTTENMVYLRKIVCPGGCHLVKCGFTVDNEVTDLFVGDLRLTSSSISGDLTRWDVRKQVSFYVPAKPVSTIAIGMKEHDSNASNFISGLSMQCVSNTMPSWTFETSLADRNLWSGKYCNSDFFTFAFSFRWFSNDDSNPGKETERPAVQSFSSFFLPPDNQLFPQGIATTSKLWVSQETWTRPGNLAYLRRSVTRPPTYTAVYSSYDRTIYMDKLLGRASSSAICKMLPTIPDGCMNPVMLISQSQTDSIRNFPTLNYVSGANPVYIKGVKIASNWADFIANTTPYNLRANGLFYEDNASQFGIFKTMTWASWSTRTGDLDPKNCNTNGEGRLGNAMVNDVLRYTTRDQPGWNWISDSYRYCASEAGVICVCPM